MKPVLVAVIAAVALGVGVGGGFFLFDKSKELSVVKGKLSERETEIERLKSSMGQDQATLAGKLTAADKENAGLKAEVERMKSSMSQDQSALATKLSAAEAASAKGADQSKQLAAFAQAAEALRATEDRVVAALCGVQATVTSARNVGWIDTDAAKAAADELVAAAAAHKKAAAAFLAARDAAGPALKDQGGAAVPLADNALVFRTDKLSDYAAKTQELWGTLKPRSTMVMAHEDWKGSIRVEKGDILLVSVEAARWKLDERVIGLGPMGGGGTKLVTEAITTTGNSFVPSQFPLAEAVVCAELPYGAVIGRVRGGEKTWLANTAGRQGVLVADAEGELEFRCNDRNLVDNGSDQKCRIQVLVLPGKALDEWRKSAEALGLK